MIARLKALIKALLYRPSGLVMGPRSVVLRPCKLHNRSRISMGADCRIGGHVTFNPLVRDGVRPLPAVIVLGNDVYVGGYTQIHAMGRVEIGDGCVLSEHVYVSDTAHGLNPSAGPIMMQPLQSRGPVVIGRGVFLGYGSSVMPGVTLGKYCVVGARAVVTHSFPPYSMIAGSPARLVKRFNLAKGQWERAT